MCLAFDRCDQHHCPQERSSDESGDLTCRLKQVAVVELKCLFPETGGDSLTAFEDSGGSKIEGDSEECQSQDEGQSDVQRREWEFTFLG